MGDPRLYEDYEYLYHQVVDLARQRGGTGARPTKEELREFSKRTYSMLRWQKSWLRVTKSLRRGDVPQIRMAPTSENRSSRRLVA
jgi:hypothetical protein